MNVGEFVKCKDYEKLTCYPKVGKYYITGMQVGNRQGEQSWDRYVGYVVQVRKKWGAWGSDLVLMRNSDGSLSSHENQFFFGMSEEMQAQVLEMFGEVTPETYEDYTEAYTICGEYPAIGKVIEFAEDRPHSDESPLVKITVQHSDGSKYIEVC